MIQRELELWRDEDGDPELFGFFFAMKGSELHLLRQQQRNVGVIRSDGGFAPMEE